MTAVRRTVGDMELDRLTLKLTPDEKAAIDFAASLVGATVSEFAVGPLVSSSREAIKDAQLMDNSTQHSIVPPGPSRN